jgi:hypothetical protein
VPNRVHCVLLAMLVWIAPGASGGEAENNNGKSPLDELPEHITRVTHFGQRADFSHDGKRILFVEKTFGDVYEFDIETKIIRPITHHYFHEGYTRALYLSNGDILLSGARKFDAANPWASRSGDNAELWVLKKDLSAPPAALGEKCSEGPAVSRKRMHIVWTVGGEFYSGDIVYEDGKPKLAKKKQVLSKKQLPFKGGIETQNLRPPAEKELIFSAYGYQGTEVCGLNLKTGKIVNYSMAPDQYDEPEGIFPDGRHTLVECDKHSGEGVQYIDLYKLALDGSGKTERLTFFSDYPGYKASNPVVSDDGRYIAFQAAKLGDPAGVGRGILIFDIEKSVRQSNDDAAAPQAEEKEDRATPRAEDKEYLPDPNEADKPQDDKTASNPPEEDKTEIIDVAEFDDAKEKAPDKKTVQANEKMLAKPKTLEGRIERIEMDYGVKVLYEYDAKAFFPAEWLAAPVSGDGSQMPRRELAEVVDAIEQFLSAYPKEVLEKNLKTIYLMSGMNFYGKGFGAAYGKSAIYVNSEGKSKGYTHQFLLSQMHSELSSIFLINYGEKFPVDKWNDINASGWEYEGTGIEMLGQSDIFAQTEELLSLGFLVNYSQSSLENDVNMFAFWAFTKAEKLKELASKYERIGRKHQLVVEFYRTIHPDINIAQVE